MRKHAIFTLCFICFGAGVSQASIFDGVPPVGAVQQPAFSSSVSAQTQQEEPREQPSQQPGRITTTTSLTAVKMQSRLSDPALFKSVLSYTLPAEFENAMDKCLQGLGDECFFSLKGFETDANPAVASAANMELAVLSMQRGMPKEALKYAQTAVKLTPDDPFPVLSSGWIWLSLGKYKKARKAFADLMYLTADFEYVSSAKLGTALSWYFDGDEKKAAQDLQYLYTSDPYTISLTAYLLGDVSSRMKGSKQFAPIFLQQALEHDKNNYAAVKLLAKLAEKEKNKLHAWQYYATLYSLDPQNKEVAKKMAKYEKEIGAKAEDFLYYLRLESPIASRVESVVSPDVKMALYATREGKPSVLQRIKLVPSGTARITDEKLGEVKNLASFQERRVEYNPQTQSVDLMDAKGHVEFSAKRPFTITLTQDDRTLLVRDAYTQNLFEADLSDKELKGSLTIIPQEGGMTLINTVRAEDLLPALLAAHTQEIRQEEALRALAVVLRSVLLDALDQQPQAEYHITDNDSFFKFKGINMVFPNLLSAVRISAGVRLQGTQPGFYEDCGPLTADGCTNTMQKPDYQFSPVNVSKYMISNPPADLVSKPQDSTHWSDVKWVYLFDAKDVEQRLQRQGKFGRLRALEPLKRTANGRILSMRFVGSKGSYEANTPQEISFLLGAGSLRSNFFEIIPFYKGKNIRSFMVRGYDTGLGVGLCLQGAEGLAKEGLDYMGVIKYYFPQARLLDIKTGQIK